MSTLKNCIALLLLAIALPLAAARHFPPKAGHHLARNVPHPITRGATHASSAAAGLTSPMSELYSHVGRFYHLSRKESVARIPFRLQSDSILFKATIGDRAVLCDLNTGAGGCLWQRSLGIKGKAVTVPGATIVEGPSSHTGKFQIIPSIRLDGLEITNLPGSSTDLDLRRITRPPQKGQGILILASPALQHTITTIDFRRRQIMIGPPVPGVRLRAGGRSAHLLKIRFSPTGVPLVPGSVGGHSALFQLDTGSNWTLVTQAFAHKYLRSFKRRTVRGIMNGAPFAASSFENIPGSVGPIRFNVSSVGVALSPLEADAALGVEFLKDYRVTVDYEHGDLLLERYQS